MCIYNMLYAYDNPTERKPTYSRECEFIGEKIYDRGTFFGRGKYIGNSCKSNHSCEQHREGICKLLTD